MSELRIFVDFAAPLDAMELLRAGTAGHQLVFPATPLASVLPHPVPAPQIDDIDVAFGQPDPRALEQAPQLRWIHVSSSGITRYDNPGFRALTAERGIALTNSASVYSEACAAHALSFILAQARQLPLALKSRAAGG
jgi:phosphoglycerate dehydrogenase-like enzyme